MKVGENNSPHFIHYLYKQHLATTLCFSLLACFADRTHKARCLVAILFQTIDTNRAFYNKLFFYCNISIDLILFLRIVICTADTAVDTHKFSMISRLVENGNGNSYQINYIQMETKP